MSEPRLRVDVAGLESTANRLADAGKRLTGIGDSAVGRTDGEGKPWGSDDPGQEFEGKYVPQRQTVTEALSGQSDFLQGWADNLNEFAKRAREL